MFRSFKQVKTGNNGNTSGESEWVKFDANTNSGEVISIKDGNEISRNISKEEFAEYLETLGLTVSGAIFKEALKHIEIHDPKSIPSSIIHSNIEDRLEGRSDDELVYIAKQLKLTPINTTRQTLIRAIKSELMQYY